jgi:hypothetical protein
VTGLVPLQSENAGLELFFLLDDASETSVGPNLGTYGISSKHSRPEPRWGSATRNMEPLTSRKLLQPLTVTAQAFRLPLWSGGASPYLSLSDLIKQWPRTSARREVVMVISGVDALGGTGPRNPYLDAAIDDAQRNGIAGHARHSPWFMNWAQSHLGQIAEETDGEAYMPGFGPPVSFGPYLDDVSAHINTV